MDVLRSDGRGDRHVLLSSLRGRQGKGRDDGGVTVSGHGVG